MFLKNRNISSKIKRSKVTDYAALKRCTCSITRTLANHISCGNLIAGTGSVAVSTSCITEQESSHKTDSERHLNVTWVTYYYGVI